MVTKNLPPFLPQGIQVLRNSTTSCQGTRILQKKKRFKNDLKAEKITKEEFDSKEKKLQAQLKDVNKRIAKLDRLSASGSDVSIAGTGVPASAPKRTEIDELKERKETLLSVIKHLEGEYKNGIITEEMYEQLKAEYKKEAIEVLKRIDELNR